MKLNKSDIGAEIISILTKGMYSDSRDALREYVQNGVDAGAKNISIKIRQDTIVVEDDGTGMDHNTMRKAVRLGVSDKNPQKNVGFMGIGIYSSFHLCDELAIFSKVKNEKPNKLVFDFKQMRNVLEEQKIARFNKQIEEDELIPLQSLLESHIHLESVSDEMYSKIGTRVEMIGIEPSFFSTLSRFKEVADYLEQNVPLPFNPRFKWAKLIEDKIDEICKKYKSTFELIHLNLQINEESANLYRPYLDNCFNPEPLKPFFYELKTEESKEFFGVAWGCLNSSRDTIDNKDLRGFLIKKQGFAIGTRDSILKYFKRQTFFNRYVGEVIIVHRHLLPNAPRTDFEVSPLRIFFNDCLRKMAQFYNDKANQYQEVTKGEEEMNEAISFIKETRAQLSYFVDNNDKLIELLWEASDYKQSIDKRIERGNIKQSKEEDAEKLVKLLGALVKDIRNLIDNKKKSIKVQSQETIVKQIKEVPKKNENVVEATILNNFLEIIGVLGIQISDDMKIILKHMDEYYLKPTCKSNDEYFLLLKKLKAEIEELLQEE